MSYSLYDRRLMILILKRQGRRSFTEGCRLIKIKNSNRTRYEPFISFKQNTKKEELSEKKNKNEDLLKMKKNSVHFGKGKRCK